MKILEKSYVVAIYLFENCNYMPTFDYFNDACNITVHSFTYLKWNVLLWTQVKTFNLRLIAPKNINSIYGRDAVWGSVVSTAFITNGLFENKI